MKILGKCDPSVLQNMVDVNDDDDATASEVGDGPARCFYFSGFLETGFQVC